MANNNGGPAFPANTLDVPFTDASNPKYLGMSLRDYFAAAALTGLIATPDCDPGTHEELVEDAYWCAELMLEQRKRYD